MAKKPSPSTNLTSAPTILITEVPTITRMYLMQHTRGIIDGFTFLDKLHMMYHAALEKSNAHGADVYATIVQTLADNPLPSAKRFSELVVELFGC